MVKLDVGESLSGSADKAAAYDAWFRAKVEKALASTERGIPHEQVMAEVREIIERARSR